MRSVRWQDTQRSLRFFGIDGRTLIFFMIAFFHVRIWTIIMAIMSMIFFTVLERKGLRFDAARRSVRAWFAGPERLAVPHLARRRYIDHGY